MAASAENGGPPDGQATAHQSVRAVRALVVGVIPAGLVIPSYTGEPELELDLAQLELIAALSGPDPRPLDTIAERVASANDVDPAPLRTLLHHLDERDLLTSQAAPLVSEPVLPLASLLTAEADADAVLVMTTPMLFRAVDGTFEHISFEGEILARLSARELAAAALFRLPVSPAAAYEQQVALLGDRALDASAFSRMVAHLFGVELLQRFDPDNPNHDRSTRNMEQFRDAIGRQMRIKHAIEQVVQADEAVEVERAAGAGGRRVRVVPVDTNPQLPPAALGLLVAYAKAYDGGRLEQRYNFHQQWFGELAHFEALAVEPSIFLFSNYLWTREENLAISAMVKRINPANITIHGGPDTPSYQDDCERFFAENPHVDITVRGEGELTFAELLDALDAPRTDPPDLRPLRDVAGLSFRNRDGVVHTAGRDRIEDLDSIPSAVLTGLFDPYAQGPTKTVILETNRGCPYGCTFCDWGSATLSRIRKFDLDRVFAELEWCAKNKIETVPLGDANFGIFERDVAIAEKIAELKSEYGYPKLLATNYAKNTVKHLRRIIEVFAEADIVAEGVVSLQTMDPGTLLTIRRKNIKVEKYNDLSAEFRSNGLPLAVDLMLGLPGSTFDSFRHDLQECINRDVRVRIHPTQLLPNSPMNEPAYRAEHGIVARPGEYVEQTTSFTRDEWTDMWRLAVTFLMGDLYGMLRQVAKYVRQEAGIDEREFYERLGDDVLSDQDRWPALAVTFRVVHHLMVPPVSWRLFIDEVHRYLVDVLGIADDDALATVLAVQHALEPSAGRHFPLELTLAHDYAAWHRAVLDAREDGHRDDWQSVVPQLREFGPAAFVVDDPEDVCHNSVGQHMVTLSLTFASFELRSPVARARIKMREPATA